LKSALCRKEVSVLLPARNEAWRIEECIKSVDKALKSFSRSYEIIVTEDGSTDQTAATVIRMSEANSNLVFLHSPTPLGKGGAIKKAFCVAKGEVVVIMDVDLATSLEFLRQIVQLVKKRSGLVLGSRHVQGSRVQRPTSRAMFSLTYNMLVNLLFLDGVRDHQCGFKAMSHEVANVLGKKIKSDSWFFDTELILTCKKLGFPLTELGVEWTEKKKKKDSNVRVFRDGSRMGLDLIKFKLNGNRL
jgi:glycosyltransferase AglD